MRQDTRSDWDWSDGFLPEVRRVLELNAFHIFRFSVATAQQDMTQATDMVVRTEGELAIAVRLRRPRFDNKFRDLTIRAVRANGSATELEKLRSGHGDFYLYGWTDGLKIAEWMLIDLYRLRESGLLERDWKVIGNTDNRTSFIAIPYYMLFEAGCVVAAQVQEYKADLPRKGSP